MNQLNEKLGGYLLQPGNSKTQLAKEMNLSYSTLNNRIAGRTKWQWNEVQRLARILNCTPNDLDN